MDFILTFRYYDYIRICVFLEQQIIVVGNWSFKWYLWEFPSDIFSRLHYKVSHIIFVSSMMCIYEYMTHSCNITSTTWFYMIRFVVFTKRQGYKIFFLCDLLCNMYILYKYLFVTDRISNYSENSLCLYNLQRSMQWLT